MSGYQFNPNAEQWKEIPGFPGYEVSDHGRARGYWKRVSNGIGKGCHMVLSAVPQRYFGENIGSSGYAQIVLKKNGTWKNKRIHRMVLEIFHGPCPKGSESCHNDGNRLNNCLTNLRWDTRKNNIHDKHKHGTAPIGIKHGRSKLSEKDVIEIRRRYATGLFYHRDLAEIFKTTPTNIGFIIRRKTWFHI